MQVHGRDAVREAYRVSVALGASRVRALVPDAVIAEGMRLTGGAGHRHAYEWIADRERAITDAVRARRDGAVPRPPFDRIVLADEEE